MLRALQTKQQIQAILSEAGISPKHRFGQNFMIDGNLLRLVAAAGDVRDDDLVVEIGPGTGSLTEELLSTGCRVIAVEIDHDLAAILRARLGDQSNFTLIEADALDGKHSLNADLLSAIRSAPRAKLVANLPYQIASPLVIDLLIAGVDLLAFTVQREVAWRLRATAGDDSYGPLSVMANLLADVHILRTLPPQAFWPAPKIESSLVRIDRRDRLGNKAEDFSRFVHAVFSYRRKMLRKAMLEAGVREPQTDAALAAIKVDPSIRPEQLSPPRWLELFDTVRAS